PHRSPSFPYPTLFRSAKRIGNGRRGVSFPARIAGWGHIERFIRTPVPVIVLAPHQRSIVGVLQPAVVRSNGCAIVGRGPAKARRSEEHTSELQSPDHL